MKANYDYLERSIEGVLSFSTLKKVPPVLLILAGLRLLFLITYPPNIYGDCDNYYVMARQWRSNLIHAGGYPCLMGALVWLTLGLALWRTWIAFRRLWHKSRLRAAFLVAVLMALGGVAGIELAGISRKDLGGIYQYYLVFLQNVVFLAGLWFVHLTLAAIFGKSIANVTVLLFALNPRTLGYVSCIFPEWLQGALLAMALCSLYWAFIAPNPGRKKLWYFLAGTAFTWCVLVKPNALVMGIVFPAVFLLERSPWKGRLACVGCLLLAALINSGSFLIIFHRPSTGTFAFTHDKAWILLDKVKTFAPDGRLNPQAGIHTKRLIYLNSVLPRGPKALLCAGPIWNINHVPPEVRAPYREKYLYVLSADETTLDGLLQEEKPAEPHGDFYYPFCPTMSFLGVAEGDALGTKVFLEHVLARPGDYARMVGRGLVSALWDGVDPDQDPGFLTDLAALPRDASWLGFAVLPQKDFFPAQRFAYPFPIVWQPGVALFAGWKQLGRMVYYNRPVFLIIVAGLLACLLRGILYRRLDTRSSLFLLLCGMLLTYYLFSNMIFMFRWKEQLPVLLLICVSFVGTLLELQWLARCLVGWCNSGRKNSDVVITNSQARRTDN